MYKVAVGKAFLQVFAFSLFSVIPPVLHTYSYICLRQWLRAGRSGDRIPVGARFSAPVHTGRGAHPASCTMGTGSLRGVKSGRGMTLTPHPLLLSWSRKSTAIPLLLLWVVRPVQSLKCLYKDALFCLRQYIISSSDSILEQHA